LQSQEQFISKDYKEALRRGFLKVDETLIAGGLNEVAEMKKANPPAKSPLMKMFADTLANRKNEQSGANENEDDDLVLDSIGCTANVVLTDYAARKIYVANAGDSRCVMGHGGKCTPLSFDHKPDC
jgi:serine/threonine protein phosphatase PrpC